MMDSFSRQRIGLNMSSQNVALSDSKSQIYIFCI